MTVFISIIIAAIIYIAYNSVTIGIFGIPKSLSETFYLYKNKYKIGFVFPLTMCIIIAFMMPAWITISIGSLFQFLSFLAPASILFVAMVPAFKASDLENKVHSISAILAAVFSILWIVLVTPFWWTILLWLVIVGIIAFFTKTYKYSLIYWLESIAFASTFTSTILYCLI